MIFPDAPGSITARCACRAFASGSSLPITGIDAGVFKSHFLSFTPLQHMLQLLRRIRTCRTVALAKVESGVGKCRRVDFIGRMMKSPSDQEIASQSMLRLSVWR
jgi:hypothetical protein